MLALSLKQMQEAHEQERLRLEAEIMNATASQKEALRARYQDRMRILASALDERRKSNLLQFNALLKQLGLAPVSALPETLTLIKTNSLTADKDQTAEPSKRKIKMGM